MKTKGVTLKKLQKVLFIPDTHVPYEDKRAFELLLKVAKQIKFDHIVILGDFADFYTVSSHDKDPNRMTGLEEEVDAVNAALDRIDALKPKTKTYVSGNHEDRLQRYLTTKAPELYNMVTIPELFKLKKRGWKYTPYKEHHKLGRIHITHDTGKAGKFANSQSLADFQDNVIIGHTHRIGYNVEGNAKGVPHVGAMFGWLGDVQKVDYMHKVKALRDWALGFGIGYLEPSTGYMHVQPVTIVNYSCVVEGKYFKV